MSDVPQRAGGVDRSGSDADQPGSGGVQRGSGGVQRHLPESGGAQRGGDVAERIPDVRALSSDLERAGYLADEPLATALFQAVRMGQPILFEGEPGVGKTEAAKALAAVIDTPLVRLQCYEGIAAAEALYEWNYPPPAARHQARRGEGRHPPRRGSVQRGLPAGTAAARGSRPSGSTAGRSAHRLIDEVDRADDEFEAFLFELLAESAVTIPELAAAARQADA
jgi:MoxR-like ATPase